MPNVGIQARGGENGREEKGGDRGVGREERRDEEEEKQRGGMAEEEKKKQSGGGKGGRGERMKEEENEEETRRVGRGEWEGGNEGAEKGWVRRRIRKKRSSEVGNEEKERLEEE
ncbi:hypothetical protein M8J76_013615 [Diaphorina citri]|nr:hypothetical protein M8J75_011300 [Diaphorina citri]KAI5716865.1 hypothetical protein M8J76_013615 [Diaphorina citri]KAI5717636.1 hypothetical protein M8J77_008960 [Diaphorina citri]